MTFTITRPGVYDGIDDATYHGDPVPDGSLSSTGARILAQPGGQAKYKQYAARPRAPKKHFDVGHLVHAAILGTGAELVEIPEEILASNGAISTKDAKEFVAAARADGKVPMKAAELEPVRSMTAAVLAHETAAPLLAHAGIPEASAFAQDPATGVWMRARPDYLHDAGKGPTTIVDLKTARSADPEHFGRVAAALGYHQQDVYYQDTVRLARGDDDARFVFVLVEKEAPYLVSVVELDDEARLVGRTLNRLALDRYADSIETGVWPGYPAGITTTFLPNWATLDLDMAV